MSMVVSICHTSVLTWTIAATLKLLSTRVEEQRDPENAAGQSRKKNYRFPKPFFPALAQARMFDESSSSQEAFDESFAKVVTILRRDLSPLIRSSPPSISNKSLDHPWKRLECFRFHQTRQNYVPPLVPFELASKAVT